MRTRSPLPIPARALLGLAFVAGAALVAGREAVAADCPDIYFLSLKMSSKSKCEAQHQLTVGSGTASPSLTSIFAENPSGLIYNQQLNLHLSASKLDDSFYSPWRYNFQLGKGNGETGGGFGAYRYNLGTLGNATSETLNMIAYGMAHYFAFANVAFGVSGFSVLGDALSVIGNSDFSFLSHLNFGMLINPKGNFRVGATLFNAFDDLRIFSVGMAAFPGKRLALALDAGLTPAYVTSGSFLTQGYMAVVRPAMGVSFEAFQFTASYGAHLSGADRVENSPTIESWAREGLTMGAAIALGPKARALAYYNRLELYYLGLSLAL